jgi:hypothetical protein
MKAVHTGPALLLALALPGALAAAEGPLALHPDNPHYFLFRGKPAVLVTSGEHYGAVLNRDFDYRPYLDELKARKFNLTRTFSGTYREIPGSFNIVENTLAPARGRFLSPWARGDTPGAGDGGHKFDLKRWDPEYFARLKDFVGEAGKRGVVVELVLFCTIYDDKLWDVNPMNSRNNVNGVGAAGRLEVYTRKDKGLTAIQEALAKKVVTELRDFDNVYFELCNEPYFGGVTKEWHDRIAAAVVEAEKGLPARHLIAQNIANGSAKVTAPNPHVSIFNFHYATPPDTVAVNFGLNKVIGDDETGFKGKDDLPYRTEGWDFLLAGGAVYSNLDYSYTCARPNGTALVTTSPGGGGPALRRQLTVLKEFMDGLDFVKMKPILVKNKADGKATARMLGEPGRSYAAYVRGGTRAELLLDLPAGDWRAEWVDTKTGRVAKAEDIQHQGGPRTLATPPYRDDIALRVKRK